MKKLSLSFLFSVLFVWVVSAFFLDTIEPYEWNPDLEKYVRVAGSVNRERNEGWGSSVSGVLGVHGIPDITSIHSKKVAIWGDSFVEAIQVDDDQKIAQVFTKISKVKKRDLMAFSVGALGGAVVDYYFDIPKYEKLVDAIEAHFIVINHKRDLLPAKKRRGSTFMADPEFKFVYKESTPKGPLVLRKLINDLNLNFIFALARSVPQWSKMRFVVGPVYGHEKKKGVSEKPRSYDESEALDFMLEKLKEQTRRPLIFVYVPRVPELSNGRFDFTDRTASFMRDFKKKCEEHGVGFMSLEPKFISFHESTGKFHNGFSNSIPGDGHLNEDGNRLVAEAMFDYVLKEGLD